MACRPEPAADTARGIDQLVTNQALSAADGGDEVPARLPRIFYLNPLAIGPLPRWAAVLDQAAAMGFTDVMVAPVFAADDLFLPADLDRAHRVFETEQPARAVLSRLAELCAGRGLALLLDVPLAALAASGRTAAEHPRCFAQPGAGPGLDPRFNTSRGAAAWARFDTEAEILAPWWATLLSGWVAAGVAGFRFLGLDRVPAACLSAIICGARGAGDMTAYGWTPGLAAERQTGLAGRGLDFVFSSLPYWDFHADWLWAEYLRLRRVAPVVMAVEAPFGPRLAAHASDAPASAKRMVGFAAAIGDGWLMPSGFEGFAHRPMESARIVPDRSTADAALVCEIAAANARPPPTGNPLVLHGGGGDSLAIMRTPWSSATAHAATLILSNLNLSHPCVIPLDGMLAGFTNIELDAASIVGLAPAETRVMPLSAAPCMVSTRPPLSETARRAAEGPRVSIEAIAPAVDDGRFPVKRIVGELVRVEADVIADGHDKVAVALLWRAATQTEWSEIRMHTIGNDRWQAEFPLSGLGRYLFTVEAWRDAFASFRDEIAKKNVAGVDLRLEAMEGGHLVEAAIASCPARLRPALEALGRQLHKAPLAAQVRTLLSDELSGLMAQADTRPRAVRPPHEFPVEADRSAARFASWYELFPRSMSDDPARHGSFADVARHLPRIRDMGFDVLYFPPIHPIGRMNRKGRNNALRAEPDDVGSPYAIGGVEGGHDATHPQLGTLADFRNLREQAARHGMELAIDFAIQCSPDHPWLKQHHDWFAWRPDGSMRFAENPPKKYEDIVNVDFYAEAAIPDLWVALCEVALFWAEQGVRIFRVDNPHTKPLPFWEWMIGEVRAKYPDALFLAEAFTRPKVMNRLGKIGFGQSYTYFTWRNTKRELTEYFTELSTPPMSDFFRPNLFVNTPDINPVPLQTAGREGFIARAVLAATLSGLWGVYCGFELCDATPLPGREEYLDSEKYQIRAWDWHRPGNIVADIARLNQIRRFNPSLQTHLGVSFLPADNDQILFYEKATRDRANVVLVAVNLTPATAQSAAIELPLWKWGLPDHAEIVVDDLLRDESFILGGKWQRIALDASAPCAIWRVRPKG